MAKKAQSNLKLEKNSKSRERFLDAAEFMFAEYGYEGAKIRAIAEHSGVNLGALHHYWGSKEELFRAVCHRRLLPMNQERLRRFDELIKNTTKETNNKRSNIDIRALFRASLEPTFFLGDLNSEEQLVFQKFYGRALTEPSPVVGEVMKELFTSVSKRFFALLKELCPHLTNDEYYWRVSCIFGTYVYVPAFSHRIAYYAHKDFNPQDLSLGISQIIEFLVAGMQAPSTHST